MAVLSGSRSTTKRYTPSKRYTAPVTKKATAKPKRQYSPNQLKGMQGRPDDPYINEYGRESLNLWAQELNSPQPNRPNYNGGGGGGGGRRYGGGGGGRRGGGGGGRGGGGPTQDEIDQRNAAALRASMQSLLTSNAFTARDNTSLQDATRTAVGKDKAALNKTYGDLIARLQGAPQVQAAQMQQAEQVDPGLMQLLAMSGADSAAYEGEIGLANVNANQANAAQQNLARQLAAASNEAQTSRVRESQQAQAYGGAELDSQMSGIMAALQARREDEQRQLDAQKMQAVMQLVTALGQAGQQMDVSQFFKR